MIMENQSRRLAEPLRGGRREKRIIAALLSCVAIVAIALGVFALTSGSREPKNCVDITFASTLGAARIHACGARAKTLCASPAPSKEIAATLEQACRRAGYPFE
jgi:hypothetical protein